MQIHSPAPNHTAAETYGSTVLNFVDGVAELDSDLPPGVRQYLVGAGYGIGPDAVEPRTPPYPDGAPAEAWTVPQLKAWASAHDVDLGEATKKADIVAALISTNSGTASFDPSAHEPDAVLEYLTSLDDGDPDARDAEVIRVVEAERAGQNRAELLEAIQGTPAS